MAKTRLARIVVGASTHYGRAELIALGARRSAPRVLDRRTAALLGPDLPSAPYHHEALELDLDDARELVARVRRSVEEHARAAVESLTRALRPDALTLIASPYDDLPDDLADVLASRPLTNAADGMLYREALADAAEELGVAVHRIPRKADPLALAAEALGVDGPTVTSLVATLGREAGAPWRKEHREAAASALSVLAPALRS